MAAGKKRSHIATNIRGLTLIELLIVCMMISLLIGIAVPSYQGVLNRQHKTEVANQLLVMLMTADRYHQAEKQYPESINALEAWMGYTFEKHERYDYKIIVEGLGCIKCIEFQASAKSDSSARSVLAIRSDGLRTGDW